MYDKTLKGIQGIFCEVPSTYEMVNHILTLGLDIFWRKKVLRFINQQDNSSRWLDVCSGTGNMAMLLRKFSSKETRVIALDFCLPMLQEALKKPQALSISFCLGSANKLPFKDKSFELVTISFATRNINITQNILLDCLCEFYRILKPGGKFINLEASQPPSKFFRRIFHLYVRLLVWPVGYILSGSKRAYSYLSHTIPRFFQAEELQALIYKAGFKKVDFFHTTGGICAIHVAVR